MSVLLNPQSFQDTKGSWFNAEYQRIAASLADHAVVGIAPAGRMTQAVLTALIEAGYSLHNIFIFDKEEKEGFPVKVLPYEAARSCSLDRIYILSPNHLQTIHKRLHSLGIPDDRIFACHVPDLMTIDEALTTIFTSPNETNLAILSDYLSEDSFCVVHCPGFFYDMTDKIRILSESMGRKIILIDQVAVPLAGTMRGVMRANLVDTLNFIDRCTRKENILFFSLHSAWHLVIPYLFRHAFPDIQIVLYMYEWLEHHFPLEKKEMLRRTTNLPMEYVDGEYEVYDRILQGGIADGIVYKHGGKRFNVLDRYPKPALCFPTVLSKALYQAPPETPFEKAQKIVFLGALPPVWQDFELFDECYVIKAFHVVTEQGFTLDIYEPRSKEIIEEYKAYFSENNRVQFFEGKPLDVILPEIAGKYHWGFMAFDHSNISTCRDMVEVALPAKVYSYAALGIPIIATEELTFVAEIVNKHGIGITLPSRDLSQLATIAGNADYGQLTENMLRFRETFCLENQQRHFVEFLQGIMDRP